jgi:hypothetical protein
LAILLPVAGPAQGFGDNIGGEWKFRNRLGDRAASATASKAAAPGEGPDRVGISLKIPDAD